MYACKVVLSFNIHPWHAGRDPAEVQRRRPEEERDHHPFPGDTERDSGPNRGAQQPQHQVVPGKQRSGRETEGAYFTIWPARGGIYPATHWVHTGSKQSHVKLWISVYVKRPLFLHTFQVYAAKKKWKSFLRKMTHKFTWLSFRTWRRSSNTETWKKSCWRPNSRRQTWYWRRPRRSTSWRESLYVMSYLVLSDLSNATSTLITFAIQIPSCSFSWNILIFHSC